MSVGPRRSRRLRLRVAAVLTAALSLGGAGLAWPPSAPAQPESKAGGDFCTTDEGVTVVVDLTALGGAIVVRCVDGPLPSGYDGWDALSDTGFRPQGVTRFPGFVCRIAGQPTASRSFDIPEDSDYHERCEVTPPTSAYWGYWYAENGGSWTYSSSGAVNHRVIEGGFEGWAFSLNRGGSPPRPGVTPRHAVTSTPTPTDDSPGTGGAGQSPKNPGVKAGTSDGSDGDSQGPSTGPTTSSQASADGGASNGPPSGKPGDDGRGSGGDDRPRDEGKAGSAPARSASAPPSTSANGDEVLVTSELPAVTAADDTSTGFSTSTLVGLGVLVLLGIGGGVTAWRRSRRA